MEGKKSTPNTVAFSMGRIEVIERALKQYKDSIIQDFRESGADDDEDLKTFANDLSKVDGILEAIAKGKARAAARKAM